MIPAHHALILHAFIYRITNHQIIIPRLLAVDPGAVGDNQHFIARPVQFINKINHNSFIVNIHLAALFLHDRTDRKPYQTAVCTAAGTVKLICAAYLVHHLIAACIICHRKSPVRTKPHIFLNPDGFQVFKRSLTPGADKFQFRQNPFCQETIGKGMERTHSLGILHDRNPHKHRHSRTYKSIRIHHKSPAVHKGNPCFIQHCIRLGVRFQNLILQQKFPNRRTPGKNFIQYCHRKRNKKQLFRFAGNNLNKIPRNLLSVFGRVD